MSAAEHVFEVVLEESWCTRRLVCLAGPTAECRANADDCGCDSWGPVRVDADGPYHEVPDFGDGISGPGSTLRHRMVWGECCAVQWADAVDVEDCYAGPPLTVARVPVDVVWENHGMVWEFTGRLPVTAPIGPADRDDGQVPGQLDIGTVIAAPDLSWSA